MDTLIARHLFLQGENERTNGQTKGSCMQIELESATNHLSSALVLSNGYGVITAHLIAVGAELSGVVVR